MRRQGFSVHPTLLRRDAPRIDLGGVALLASILASGAVFAGCVAALIWGFALIEAVLT